MYHDLMQSGDKLPLDVQTPDGVELSPAFLSLLPHAKDPLGLYVIERDELWLINRDAFAGIPAADWRDSFRTRLDPNTHDAFDALLYTEHASRRGEIRFEEKSEIAYELTATIHQPGVLCISLRAIEADTHSSGSHLGELLASAAAAASMGREMNGQLTQITLGIDEAWATLHRALDLAADGIGANFYLRMIEESLEMLESSLEGSRRVRDLISKLQVLSHEREPERRRMVDCGELLRSSVSITSEATGSRATVEVSVEKGLTVWAQRADLIHAIVNLVEDAARRIPRGNPEAHILELRARHVGESVEIEIQGTGEPFAESELTRAFDLEFGVTRGIEGLRLPLAAHVARNQGGQIEIKENSHDGAIVRLTLPFCSEPPMSASVDRPSILIIDDERALLDVLQRQLSDTWDVVTFEDAPHAVSLIRDNSERFDIILCDLTMRAMSGFRIYHAVTNTNPELANRFLFMTGGAFTPESEVFTEAFSDRVLMKPFSKEDLLTTIELMQVHDVERMVQTHKP